MRSESTSLIGSHFFISFYGSAYSEYPKAMQDRVAVASRAWTLLPDSVGERKGISSPCCKIYCVRPTWLRVILESSCWTLPGQRGIIINVGKFSFYFKKCRPRLYRFSVFLSRFFSKIFFQACLPSLGHFSWKFIKIGKQEAGRG